MKEETDTLFKSFIKNSGINKEYLNNIDRRFFITYKGQAFKNAKERYLFGVSYKDDPISSLNKIIDEFEVEDYTFYLIAASLQLNVAVIGEY